MTTVVQVNLIVVTIAVTDKFWKRFYRLSRSFRSRKNLYQTPRSTSRLRSNNRTTKIASVSCKIPCLNKGRFFECCIISFSVRKVMSHLRVSLTWQESFSVWERERYESHRRQMNFTSQRKRSDRVSGEATDPHITVKSKETLKTSLSSSSVLSRFPFKRRTQSFSRFLDVWIYRFLLMRFLGVLSLLTPI